MTPKIWNEFVPQFSTKPVVNQVEFNPFFQQKVIREIMAKDDVKLEAWYPLGHGNQKLLTHPLIGELAQKYNKNPGQIILRFEVANSHFPRPAGPHFLSSQGHIKRSALEIGRARGAPPC